MPLQFPSLSDSPLELMNVYLGFSEDDTEALDLLKSLGEVLVSCVKEIDGEAYFAQFFVRSFSGAGHLHCQLYFAKGANLRHDASTPTPQRAEEFDAMLANFLGRSCAVFVSAKFDLPLSSLPEDGVVKGLTGMAAVVGDRELTSVGMEMRISGEPYDFIDWRVSDERVIGKLWASKSDQTFDEDRLIEAKHLIENGLNELLLEKKGE